MMKLACIRQITSKHHRNDTIFSSTLQPGVYRTSLCTRHKWRPDIWCFLPRQHSTSGSWHVDTLLRTVEHLVVDSSWVVCQKMLFLILYSVKCNHCFSVCLCMCRNCCCGLLTGMQPDTPWSVSHLSQEWPPPLPSSRHHLSYDDCTEDKRENYHYCSVLCCCVVYNQLFSTTSRD